MRANWVKRVLFLADRLSRTGHRPPGRFTHDIRSKAAEQMWPRRFPIAPHVEPSNDPPTELPGVGRPRGQARVGSQSGSGSRAASQPSGTPPWAPTPVYAATTPPTIAAVVSTSPPAVTQARIADG
jgi:hypothetical protein